MTPIAMHAIKRTRTPLTALKGYSELYERGMLETPEALDRAISRVGDARG